MTAGEVHLERCIRDLKETYAKVEVMVSSPIVPFRETIIDPPKIDMVNEEIVNANEDEKEKIVTLTTSNKQCSVTLLALPLPSEAVSSIETHQDLLKAEISGVNLTTESIAAKEAFKDQLEQILNQSPHEELHDISDKILSFGPKSIGSNILVKSKQCSSIGDNDKYLSSLINGFQLATLAGPLCEEPLSGCSFICLEFNVDETLVSDDSYGPLSGQIVSIVKEGCRRAFQAHPQRLQFYI